MLGCIEFKQQLFRFLLNYFKWSPQEAQSSLSDSFFIMEDKLGYLTGQLMYAGTLESKIQIKKEKE